MQGAVYDVQAHLVGLTPLTWEEIRGIASNSLAHNTIRDEGGTLRATYAGMQECVRVVVLAAPMSYNAKADIARDWSIDTNAYMALLSEME